MESVGPEFLETFCIFGVGVVLLLVVALLFSKKGDE